jgi:hypothetical protein
MTPIIHKHAYGFEGSPWLGRQGDARREDGVALRLNLRLGLAAWIGASSAIISHVQYFNGSSYTVVIYSCV